MLEDEQKLVERAQGGESDAFGSLYDFYLPKIYRFVLFKVSRREEAEDLTHQTFIKAWEHIGQYEPRGHSFGSWLYQIARNAVTDYHRRGGTHISIEEIPEHAVLEEETQDRNADASIEREAIMNAIARLKDIEQDVLIMRFIDELAHKEVAEAIGKTEGAVKVIQHRALKNLRNILEENEK